jgi:hypothetical protein
VPFWHRCSVRRREESDVIATREHRQFIGGAWVDAADGATFDNLDPFTGRRPSRRSPPGARTTRVARSMRRRPPSTRCGAEPRPPSASGSSSRPRTCSRVAATRIVEPLARETGCGFGFGMFQMGFVPASSGRRGDAVRADRPGHPSEVPERSRWGLRRPVGVVGSIAPLERRAHPLARTIAAPLALGNSVVLKPSEGRRSRAA